jgi:hypothetical protein
VVEPALEPLEDVFSVEDDEVVDSELEPFDALDELAAELLAESRLSLR